MEIKTTHLLEEGGWRDEPEVETDDAKVVVSFGRYRLELNVFESDSEGQRFSLCVGMDRDHAIHERVAWGNMVGQGTEEHPRPAIMVDAGTYRTKTLKF